MEARTRGRSYARWSTGALIVLSFTGTTAVSAAVLPAAEPEPSTDAAPPTAQLAPPAGA